MVNGTEDFAYDSAEAFASLTSPDGSVHITSGYVVCFARPNPYGLRISATRYPIN